MKFKNLFSILFVLLLCSGCSVTYDLNIDSKLNLAENISIDADTNSEIQKISDYDQFLPISYYADESSIFTKKKDGVEYYNLTKKEDNTNIKFDYVFDIDKFNNSAFARSCYNYITVMKSYNNDEHRNELLISTSKEFLCFENYDNLDNVTIKIHTNRTVYSNNANSVDKNTYTWDINESNKNNASIQMVIDSEIIDEGIPFWEQNILFIIVAVAMLISLIIYIFVKKRSDKVNKI